MVNALPELDEHPSFLPTDVAGQGSVELLFRPSPPPAAVYHVVNPNTTTSWMQMLDGFRQAGVRFEELPHRDWLKRLEGSEQDGAKNPTYKLLVSVEIRKDC